MMQSQSGAPQPLCSSSHYNLHQTSGRSEVEFTVSEEEDDPDSQEEEGGKIVISFTEVDDSGNVVCSKVMETDEVPVLPPGEVTVIEDASKMN
ncbi:hypothetical protein B7P43_G08003 [Cryptotermes secundus]|uniref:Uncharacterized protein n=2 Tax=Cryptotermes secundus TaxID=105785 RepID=A0A2J7PSI5_9NEOP|nr:hypothetical protein B7P43_G08003 [Cryptotermes secundus]